MFVTLDQARALDALARHGTFALAAKALHKAHTAVLYAVKQLESQTDLTLLDRSSYRSKLTPAGEAVLVRCRALLAEERKLLDACQTLKSGWEPTLRLVFDAVYPLAPVLEVVKALREEAAPTRVEVTTDSLAGVEQRFLKDDAHAMVTVLPVDRTELVRVKLKPLTAHLVAGRRHPLAQAKGTLSPGQLEGHVLVTVQGSDPRLNLPTAEIDKQSLVRVPDFHAKKAALVAGLGFGWLPDWLIQDELRDGVLRPLKLTGQASHRFEPSLYHRPLLGPAGQRVVDALLHPRRAR